MLSVDENLGDLDRTCLLLTTGQDVQKVCVIQNMPELLKNQQMETLCRVIPKLCVSEAVKILCVMMQVCT